MNDHAEFYAKVRERLAASRALMDAAEEAMRRFDRAAASDLLDRARNQQDAMLREMREMNEARS